MKRENISAEEARRILLMDDEERRKWSKSIYGIDTWDPGLYDLVIKIKCIKVDSAVETIKSTLKDPCFQATPESQKLVDDLSLAARIEAALIEDIRAIQVEAKGTEVSIFLKRDLCKDEELMSRVKRLASKVAGFDVKVDCLVRP
jgi:hypothetical protein